jgi:hypothetical protein
VVAMEAALQLEHEAALEAAKHRPKLTVLQGGVIEAPQVLFPTDMVLERAKTTGNRRINPLSLYDVPDGHQPCANPVCNLLVTYESRDSDGVMTCAAGHSFDPMEEARRRFENRGGISNSGLTNTQQGKLGEAVVTKLGHLGEFGPIEPASDEYAYPLDFLTPRFGVEVKSGNVRNVVPGRFIICGNRQPAKLACVKKHGREGLVGAYVVINYTDHVAAVYARHLVDKDGRDIRTYDVKPEHFIAKVDIDDLLREIVPHLYQNELALAGAPAEDPMPF